MSFPRRLIPVVLCLALAGAPLLAGCLDSEPSAPAPAPASDDSGDLEEEKTTTPAPKPATPKPVTPKPPERQVVAIPFAYNGSTQAGACVQGPNLSECRFPVAGTAIAPLMGDGNPLRLVANVTWTGATPATETLHASLAFKQGENWTVFDYPGWSFTGKSPLAVAWDLRGAPPGITWGIAVTAADPFDAASDAPKPVPTPPLPVTGSVDVPQAYHVAGDLVVLAPPVA